MIPRYIFYLSSLASTNSGDRSASHPDQCLSEGACPPTTLDSGLIRYTAVDYRPWMKGCTFWFDVDPATRIVKAVGYTGAERHCAAINLN
jgi:hypothetical protein